MPSAAGPADVEIGIDPTLFVQEEVDYLILLTEVRGKGRLRLSEGDVISGRVLTEGLDAPPGATIHVAGDTELVIFGDSVLDLRLVPLPEAFSENWEPDVSEDHANFADAPEQADDASAPWLEGHPPSVADDGAPDMAFAQGAPGGPIQPTCAGLVGQTGKRGKKPPKVNVLFNGNLLYLGLAPATCAGPLPIQTPDPQPLLVVGNRSARAIGGHGGPGLDVVIRGLGNSTLTIAGDICNGAGADGGNAIALGIDGPPCDCGGDAYARGGNGGHAGTLNVSARNIVWNMALASITVNSGGAGGAATAIAGDGGDCNICGGTGGRGGHATALGGQAGRNGRIQVQASQIMVPPPAVVLASGIFTANSGADGGIGAATAGLGGHGGDCDDCNQSGGPGGPGGNAFAKGADGARNSLLAAIDGGVVTAYYGSDAGWGGDGLATAGEGGRGGHGASCPCSLPLQAGSGGLGGKGGGATARGGKGGDANGGKLPLAVVVAFAGWGGDGIAECGRGGDGGNGGWCVDDNPELCTPGLGGPPGPGGVKQASGGKGGKAIGNAAIAGPAGLAVPPVATACPPGDPGASGQKDCPDLPGDQGCCVPGSFPGCKDPACTALVCAQDPFCCNVLWDGLCAQLANQICPVCSAGPSCCVPGPQPGCGDPLCAGLVCANDPFCCEVQWDLICANLAAQVCPACAGGSANCCLPNPGPGCGSNFCMSQVCQFLPHCCQVQWDAGCAGLAQEFCPECAPAS